MSPRTTTRVQRPSATHAPVEAHHPSTRAPAIRLGPVDDPWERQADAVADQVMSGLGVPETVAPAVGLGVQRDAGEAAATAPGGMVDASVGAEIHAARGQGIPLPDGVRAPMERALGNDFSGVRVHTGAQSERLNRALGSNAFTTGRDVFFGRDRYDPDAPEGQRLIAHELTHVVQQGGDAAGGGVQRSPVVQREFGGRVTRSNPKGRVFKRTFDPREGTERRKREAERLRRERREEALWKRRMEKAPTPESTPFTFSAPTFGSPSFGSPSPFSSPSPFGTFGSPTPFGSPSPFGQSFGSGSPFGGFGTLSGSSFQDSPPPTYDPSGFGSYREPQKPSQEQIRQEQLERGRLAAQEIEYLSRTVNDTDEMEDHFDSLQFRYGLQWIGFVDLGTPAARVAFKINPEFEVKLVGTNMEMRAQGSTKGATQTKVEWSTRKLTLDGAADYIVGTHMEANPLSTDHPEGTESKADTDQKWMTLLPSASGSVSDGYVKGHLLNHDLGGIANQQNLFPITGWANSQHKTYAEQYIKSGINNGYVYGYRVDVGNIKEGTLTSGEYYVDADLAFDLARLDATGGVVPNTRHTGIVKSRYETNVANRPDGPWSDVKAEYKHDYTGGKPSQPKKVGAEDTLKVKQKGRGKSNAGLATTLASGTAFSYGTPTPFGSNPFTTAQSINPTPTFAAKLSLVQSPAATVETQFASIVTGWKATDIQNWVAAVQASSGPRKWADVEAEAVKHNLDATVAAKVFDVGGPGRTKTSINGKP